MRAAAVGGAWNCGQWEMECRSLGPAVRRELDLEPQAPDPLPCPHCGKPLGRLGINVEGRVLWVSHEPCG